MVEEVMMTLRIQKQLGEKHLPDILDVLDTTMRVGAVGEALNNTLYGAGYDLLMWKVRRIND